MDKGNHSWINPKLNKKLLTWSVKTRGSSSVLNKLGKETSE